MVGRLKPIEGILKEGMPAEGFEILRLRGGIVKDGRVRDPVAKVGMPLWGKGLVGRVKPIEGRLNEGMLKVGLLAEAFEILRP